MKKQVTKYNGFTLLEVLISLAIVSAVLITIIYTVNYHLSLIQRHEIMTVATMLGKEKINTVSEQQLDKKGSFPEPYQDYAYEINVKDSPFEKVKIVNLSVTKDGERIDLSKFIKVDE
jgi:general secretion pathway protein I